MYLNNKKEHKRLGLWLLNIERRVRNGKDIYKG